MKKLERLNIKLKKNIENAIKFIFNLFDSTIKKKSFIVFSSRAAKDYADNSKELFEYFLSKGANNVYFYTKKKSVLKKIPKNGIYAYSLRGVYILAKSKILIFTHGNGDFFPYYPPKRSNRIFINLFHAIAVKKVSHNNIPSKIKEIKSWDYFSVSSDFEAEFMKENYSLADHQIIVTGQPRNDILFKYNTSKKANDTKLILYAPTFRDKSITRLFPFDDIDYKALDDFLGKNNMKIMIRLHINEERIYKKSDEFQQLKNIFFAGSDIYPDVNAILPKIDALITDYSSIALDYLILDRPIAYIPYDYDIYNKERGFSFDYHKYRAGPVISSQKDLINFLKFETDDYKLQRDKLKKLFHKFRDGRASERLYNLINNL